MNASPSKPTFLYRVILHPFAFALVPILSLYSHNLGQAFPEMVFFTTLIVLSLTGLLFFLLKITLRKPELAGLITCLFVLFIFLYGSFSTFIMKFKFGDFVFLRNVHRVPLYTGLFLIFAFGMFKLHKRWTGLNKFLNVFSICLFVVNLLSFWWLQKTETDPDSPLVSQNAPSKPAAVTPDANSPDIYYIILDGYGSAGVLQKYFGYDNSDFTESLKTKGFYFPANPRSNYGMTALSLGSSLSMDYLRKDSMELPQSMVQPFVEAKGYNYISFSSMKPRLTSQAQSGFSWRSLFQNEFSLQLLRTTVLDPFALRVNFYAYTVRNNIQTSFNVLQQLPEQPGKKFVFAHFLCPHPPYVFKADGGSPSMNFAESNLSLYRTPWDDKDAYIQQARYLNTKVIETIDIILQKSKVPPVIVIQGDHGPKLTLPDLATTIDMHMRILNAYYLPGNGRTNLYDTITPVNSFRAIFNHCFHAGLPMLEDKCYFSSVEQPFVYSDVTAELLK
jgi:hypothetical protein